MVSNGITGKRGRGGGRQFNNKNTNNGKKIKVNQRRAAATAPPNVRQSELDCVMQIPDNPGYVDFNDPSPPTPRIAAGPKAQQKEGNRPPKQQQRQNQQLGKPRRNGFNQGTGGNNGGHVNGPAMFQPRNFRHPIRMPPNRPPIPPHPMGMRPPIPPPPHMNAVRFNGGGRPPMIPPPMPGGPPGMMPPRGPPVRRGRNGPMPLPPLPPPPMLRGNHRFPGPPPQHVRKMFPTKDRIKAQNRKRPGLVDQPDSSSPNKTAKRTLKEILNQFPLDKPWVTEEIKCEQKKKEDIENRLKGRKDDALFADFKIQRDKFVTMYEAAQLEYLGKNSEKDVEKILTDSDKEKGEHSCNNANNE